MDAQPSARLSARPPARPPTPGPGPGLRPLGPRPQPPAPAPGPPGPRLRPPAPGLRPSPLWCPEVDWFLLKKVVTPDGIYCEPLERYCWACGTTCETWPLEKKEAITGRIQNAAMFRKEFFTIREGVKLATASFKKYNSHVFSGNGVKCRVFHQTAFVLQADYTQHFGVECGSPGCSAKLSTLFTDDGEAADGAIMALQDIPPTLPFLTVETEAFKSRCYRKSLVSPETAMRPEQAIERYSLALTNMMRNRPAPLLKGPLATYAELKAEADAVQRERSTVTNGPRIGVVENHVSTVVGGGTLADDDAPGGRRVRPRLDAGGGATPAVAAAQPRTIRSLRGGSGGSRISAARFTASIGGTTVATTPSVAGDAPAEVDGTDAGAGGLQPRQLFTAPHGPAPVGSLAGLGISKLYSRSPPVGRPSG